MALEDAMNRLADLVERQNAILSKISAEGSASKAASGDKAAGKPRGRPAKKDDDEGGEGGVSFDPDRLKAVRQKVKDWLSEFKEDEADPETAEREKVLDAALTKLGDGERIKISEITDDAMTDRIEKWIDTKIEKGRLKPAPKAKAKGGEDDDI